MKYGAASIYVFTLGKLIPLVGFIVVALIAWRHNPIPASMHLPGPGTDWSGAALFMLFAYAGFENMGVPAGEFRNPRKELPRALLVGTLAIAAIYVLAQLGAMSALPDLSKTATPIADAAAALIGSAGAIIVTLGALLSMAGTNSGTVLEGSRMLYAISLGRPRLRADQLRASDVPNADRGHPDPRRVRRRPRLRRIVREIGDALRRSAADDVSLHLRRRPVSPQAERRLPNTGARDSDPRHR